MGFFKKLSQLEFKLKGAQEGSAFSAIVFTVDEKLKNKSLRLTFAKNVFVKVGPQGYSDFNKVQVPEIKGGLIAIEDGIVLSQTEAKQLYRVLHKHFGHE